MSSPESEEVLAETAEYVLAFTQNNLRMLDFMNHQAENSTDWELHHDRNYFTNGKHVVYYDNASNSLIITKKNSQEKINLLIDGSELLADPNLSEAEALFLIELFKDLLKSIRVVNNLENSAMPDYEKDLYVALKTWKHNPTEENWIAYQKALERARNEDKF